MKRLLGRQYFNGEDPIMVLDFLAPFTCEEGIQDMTEAQAFAALPLFLKRFAFSRYDAMVGWCRQRKEGLHAG